MTDNVMFIATHLRQKHLDIPVHIVYNEHYDEMWQRML
jgi:hypothetical protein